MLCIEDWVAPLNLAGLSLHAALRHRSSMLCIEDWGPLAILRATPFYFIYLKGAPHIFKNGATGHPLIWVAPTQILTPPLSIMGGPKKVSYGPIKHLV